MIYVTRFKTCSGRVNYRLGVDKIIRQCNGAEYCGIVIFDESNFTTMPLKAIEVNKTPTNKSKGEICPKCKIIICEPVSPSEPIFECPVCKMGFTGKHPPVC